MELEITWGRVIRIWWAYLWRNLIAIIGAMVLGGVFGFIIGAILGLLGFSVHTIQIVVMPFGLLAGLVMSVIPLRLILGMNFGDFRLVLISTAAPPSVPSS